MTRQKTNRLACGLAALLAAMMLARADAVFAQGPFADVPAGHPAEAAVNELAKQGLINGYPDNTFGGNRAMTRYEVAIFLARTRYRVSVRDFTPITLPPKPPPSQPFTDVPKDYWAVDAVQEAHEWGFLLGRPDGTFGGDQVMTRAEFAVVLQRLHAYIVQLIELNRQPAPPGR